MGHKNSPLETEQCSLAMIPSMNPVRTMMPTTVFPGAHFFLSQSNNPILIFLQEVLQKSQGELIIYTPCGKAQSLVD